ncbi:MAG: molecular chaperone DnaK [Burkholderiales bacterium]|nr:molecular chaperone DnaK [Burkholderiales bacterium]
MFKGDDQVKSDATKFHHRLSTELQQLVEAIAQAEASAGTVRLDQSSVGRVSRMDAMQQQAMARGLQERLATRKRKTEAALARIESGTYGRCCECQTELKAERIDADPAAVFCAACAAERETL